MKNYKATIYTGGEEPVSIEFTTEGNPIEYLWSMYGMSVHISSLEEITDSVESND